MKLIFSSCKDIEHFDEDADLLNYWQYFIFHHFHLNYSMEGHHLLTNSDFHKNFEKRVVNHFYCHRHLLKFHPLSEHFFLDCYFVG